MLTFALSLLVSCNDAYPGLDYDNGKDPITNTEQYDRTPLMVFVNGQNFFSISASRAGTGAMGDEHVNGYLERLKDARFFVYAFRASTDEQGPNANDTPDLRVTLNDEERENGEQRVYWNCLLDGSRYDNANKAGMEARLNMDEGGNLVWYPRADETFYYSARHQETGYNFFAYYIDQEEPNSQTGNGRIVRSERDRVYYDDFAIDGAMDLMCGYAPKLTRELIWEKKKGLSETEVNRILNIGMYSTYAAHREIHPEIDLKHQLTRLKFKAMAGDAPNNDGEYIEVNRISVNSLYKGEFVVAATDTSKVGFHPDGSAEYLILRDKVQEDETIGKDTYAYPVRWVDGKEEQDKVDIGESLLVYPDDVYRMRIEYTQYLRNKDGETFRPVRMMSEYDLKAPQNGKFFNEETGQYEFKAGHVHNVTITVYGLEEINVDISLSKWNWDEDGDINIDPDDPDNNGNDIVVDNPNQ